MITLMYHRISPPDTNPWGVCVSPEHFEEQIAWIAENFRVIDPATLNRQFQERRIDPESVLITFDDGYQDNFLTARPVLEKYQCPATFFVPTRFIGEARPFWWDELELIILHSPTLPSTLELLIAGKPNRFTLSGPLRINDYDIHRQWRWFEKAPTDRCAVFLAVWKLLRPLCHTEIETVMKTIRDWSNQHVTDFTDRPVMTARELKDLAAYPAFDIGLHTHSHPDLWGKSDKVQTAEMVEARRILKEEFNLSGRWFAYPYGRYDATTLALVARMELELCFTTTQGTTDLQTSVFELSRTQAPDLPLNQFQQLILQR